MLSIFLTNKRNGGGQHFFIMLIDGILKRFWSSGNFGNWSVKKTGKSQGILLSIVCWKPAVGVRDKRKLCKSVCFFINRMIKVLGF